jgi:DNA-binding winged helix-turn-helix (wHTH) protein
MRLRFGECTFDSETRELLREGRSITLSSRAFDLLGRLLEQRPRPASRADLLRALWKDGKGSEGELAALMLELKGAIETKGQDQPFLRSSGAEGYAFSGRAEEDRRPTVPGAGYKYRLLWDDREIPLSEGDNVIGRDYDALVRIDSPKVSRRHARIVISAEQAILEDLGSRNGTRRNDAPMTEPAALADGDRIGIGPFLLIFRSPTR